MSLLTLNSIADFAKCLLLAENRDPMALIMGPAFAKVDSNDDALLKAHEMVSKSRDDGSEDAADLENSFRLLLLINQLDIQLLHSSLKDIAKYVKYTCLFLTMLTIL